MQVYVNDCVCVCVCVCWGERRARTEPFCPHLKLNVGNVTCFHGYQSAKLRFLLLKSYNDR